MQVLHKSVRMGGRLVEMAHTGEKREECLKIEAGTLNSGIFREMWTRLKLDEMGLCEAELFLQWDDNNERSIVGNVVRCLLQVERQAHTNFPLL
jgi:hypothetical protein